MHVVVNVSTRPPRRQGSSPPGLLRSCRSDDGVDVASLLPWLVAGPLRKSGLGDVGVRRGNGPHHDAFRWPDPIDTQLDEWQGCRVASRMMLPSGFVASPEMLPARVHATMLPRPPGRHHDGENDPYDARRARQRYPKTAACFISGGVRANQHRQQPVDRARDAVRESSSAVAPGMDSPAPV